MPESRSNNHVLGVPSLWFAMLGAPIVWALSFLLTLIFAQWACSAGIADTRLLGIGIVNGTGILITFAAAGVTIYAGQIAYRQWKGERGRENTTNNWTEGRRRFMMFFSLIAAGIFLAGLIFQAIALLFLPPCLF